MVPRVRCVELRPTPAPAAVVRRFLHTSRGPAHLTMLNGKVVVRPASSLGRNRQSHVPHLNTVLPTMGVRSRICISSPASWMTRIAHRSDDSARQQRTMTTAGLKRSLLGKTVPLAPPERSRVLAVSLFQDVRTAPSFIEGSAHDRFFLLPILWCYERQVGSCG